MRGTAPYVPTLRFVPKSDFVSLIVDFDRHQKTNAPMSARSITPTTLATMAIVVLDDSPSLTVSAPRLFDVVTLEKDVSPLETDNVPLGAVSGFAPLELKVESLVSIALVVLLGRDTVVISGDCADVLVFDDGLGKQRVSVEGNKPA